MPLSKEFLELEIKKTEAAIKSLKEGLGLHELLLKTLQDEIVEHSP